MREGVSRLVELLRRNNCSYIVEGRRVHAFARHKMTSLCSLLGRRPIFLRKTRITSGIMKGTTTTLVILKNIQRICASVVDRPTLTMLRGTGVEIRYIRVISHV